MENIGKSFLLIIKLITDIFIFPFDVPNHKIIEYINDIILFITQKFIYNLAI